MTVEKIIEKMKNQPNGVRFAEAQKVLEHFGYTFKRQKGSHCQFKNKDDDTITVVKENPLKKSYAEDILKLKSNSEVTKP